MSQEIRTVERQKVLDMVEVEEKLGPVVSGGPFRYVTAPAEQTGQAKPSAISLAATRARGRVRFVAYAIATARKQAA